MLHQVTRVMPGVSSAKSSAWLAVPAVRPARENYAMGRNAAGPRPPCRDAECERKPQWLRRHQARPLVASYASVS